MKKIVFFVLFCLNVCLSVNAENPSFDLSNVSIMNFNEMLASAEGDPTFNEEILIKLVFSVPPEYHQYVMPMVANMTSISEKTRMMPGIVEWRRKLPTRIAPELTEYASKHLKYLNPAFYPFLMPESWPSYYEQMEKEHSHEKLPIALDISTPEKMEQAFPSSINPNSSLGMLMKPDVRKADKKDEKDALSEKDIKSVMNIISKFKVLGEGPEGKKRRNILLLDFKDRDVLLEAIVNPCASMVDRFEKIDTDGWLDLQLKKENMTKEEYSQKCDRIVKAYRLRQINSAQAKEVVRLTKEAMLLPEDSFYRKIYLTLSHMYRTNREDVKALKGYDEQLKKTFKEKKMIMSTPVVLDF